MTEENEVRGEDVTRQGEKKSEEMSQMRKERKAVEEEEIERDSRKLRKHAELTAD